MTAATENRVRMGSRGQPGATTNTNMPIPFDEGRYSSLQYVLLESADAAFNRGSGSGNCSSTPRYTTVLLLHLGPYLLEIHCVQNSRVPTVFVMPTEQQSGPASEQAQ